MHKYIAHMQLTMHFQRLLAPELSQVIKLLNIQSYPQLIKAI